MSSDKVKPDNGRPLSPGAIALMLLLCLSWGFNQIAVKLALAGYAGDDAGDLPLGRRVAGAVDRRLGAQGRFLDARRHARPRHHCRRAVRPRVRADLSGAPPHHRLARGGVPLHRAVLCRARVLPHPRRAAARLAMGRARAELRRGCARDRRAAARCRQPRVARRSPDRRRRHDVGRDHCDRQGNEAAARRAGKGAGLSGRDFDSDSRRRSVAVGRAA